MTKIVTPPAAGRGRPKGAKNKVSGTAKANLVAVFDKVGGVAQMARWAKDNETEFYKLYARLVPVEAEHSGGVTVRLEYVDADE